MMLFAIWACAPKSDIPPPVAEVLTTAVGLPSPDTPLPRSPDLAEGTLENGLDWYIRANTEPSARAELRLIVKAGSVYEDDDQQGLAHLLEHMAFNGTEHFGESELVATLESLGMEFGAHTNAYTSTDETVYKLRVPTDDPVALETAFTVLGDWSSAMTLADDAIERERGVVLEEWRRSRGVGGRLRDATWPALWGASPYATRLPIGTEESLNTFEPEAVRRFYRDWYRPDKMAVVAVGDFDPEDIQARIEATFGELTRTEHVRPDPVLPPPGTTDHVVVVADAELTSTSAEIDRVTATREDASYGGYRERLISGLALGAFSERCRTLRLSDSPPFLGCGGGRQRMTPGFEIEVGAVGTQDERLMEGLEALFVEIERFRTHGLTQAELDRLRQATLSRYDGLVNEQAATPSARLADELVRVATTGESVAGIVHEHAIVVAMLPTVTLEEVNAAAAQFLAPGQRLISIRMPAREGLAVPTEEQVLALLKEVGERDLAPPKEIQVEGPLIDSLPDPGSILERQTLDDLGIEIWRLSNGAEVWLKPTDFKADQVLFEAWSPGGRAMVSDEAFVPAKSAPSIQARSGLGSWSASDLALRLQATRASASAKISRYSEGVTASASPEFLEDMFQLVWLQMTSARFEPQALTNWSEQTLTSARNRLNNPSAVLDDRYQSMMWNDNLRMAPWSEETLSQLDLAASEQFWRERFGHAGDFTFVIVGAIDPATVEPLVLRYLASLPADGTDDSPQADSAVRAQGALSDTVYSGIEDKAHLKWRFHGPFENTSENRIAIGTVANLLEVLLREELREDLGGVYSVSVSPRFNRIPEGYTLTIQFQCDPARLDELQQATEDVLHSFLADGITPEKLAAEQAMRHRSWETRLETNSFWRSQIRRSVEHQHDLQDLVGGYYQRLDSLTPESLQATATQVLDFDSFVRVRLMPADLAPME